MRRWGDFPTVTWDLLVVPSSEGKRLGSESRTTGTDGSG